MIAARSYHESPYALASRDRQMSRLPSTCVFGNLVPAVFTWACAHSHPHRHLTVPHHFSILTSDIRHLSLLAADIH